MPKNITLTQAFLVFFLIARVTGQARDGASADVRHYGAGNGEDDTQAIQNALKDVCSAPHGRELYFSPGTYHTNSTVEIPCDYITLRSNGSLWKHHGPSAAIVIRGPGVLVRILNLKLQGDNSRGGVGVQVLGGTQAGSATLIGITKLIVDACEFTAFGKAGEGAAIDIEADSPGVTIRDSVFVNEATAININAPTDTLSIRDNYIVSSSGWGVQMTNGIGAASVSIEHNNFTTAGGAARLERAGAVTIRDNEFETYHFAGNGHAAAFDLISAQRIVFDGNSINPHEGADSCLWVGDSVTDSVFERNTLFNCGPIPFRVGAGRRNYYRLNIGWGPSAASGIQTVPYSPTVRFDVRLNTTQKLVLSGNVESSELVNAAPGQRVTFILCQDSHGGRRFRWPAGFSGAMKVSQNASACSVQEFLIDASNKAFALGPGSRNP